MKKINLLTILCAFLLVAGLAACEQENYEPSITKNLDLQAGSKLLASFEPLSGLDAQRTAFSALSKEEKNLVWQTKFSNLGNSSELNSEQRALINELKGIFNPEVFVLDSREHTVSLYQIDEWLTKAEDKFTDFQLYSFFHRVKSISSEEAKVEAKVTKNSKNSKGTITAKINYCECNVGSRYTCGRLVGLWQLEYGDCYPGVNSCGMTSDGCGFAFAYRCDGGKCNYN